MSNKITSFKVGFRQANVIDVSFLVMVRKQSMSEHLERAGIFMTDEQHRARVLEFFSDSHLILLNQVPIGVIKLGDMPESVHIRQFQLLPKYHSKGIGTKVLNVVKKKAQEKKKPITLCVLLENPAKDLYLREGFEITNSDKLQHYMHYSNAAN